MYTMAPEPWQHAQITDYPYVQSQAIQSMQAQQHHVPLDTLSEPYSAPSFDYAASLRAASYLTGSSSHMMSNTSELSPIGDPTAAWQSLAAQFNHT